MMEMDDETLLKMTKTRLSILRMPELTLQKLALKCIAKNYRFYARNQNNEQNPEQLPKPLRNKLLEEFSNHLIIGEPCYTPREMNLRVAMFERLVNSRTMKVDLTGFMYCHDKRVNLEEFLTKLLSVLADNAPNLQELKINECDKRKYFDTREVCLKLSQLRMLKSLKLSPILTFGDIYDLGNVCRHLPNLQVLWVSVNHMYRELPDLQYLESCFPSLIVHFIKENDHRPRFKRLEFLLDELCCRNAESLEMVDKSKSRIFCNCGTNVYRITERTIYTGTPGQFRKVSIEMLEETRRDTSAGKKYNRYYEEDWELLTDRSVPVDEENDSPEASRFNSMRFVHGGERFPEAIEIYQASCWQNMHTISVEDLHRLGARGHLEMSLIAERCPNLERLVIKDADIMINPALNPVNLSSLRDLELDVPETLINHDVPSLSHIFLAAPNLERVRLEGTVDFFTVEGLKVVTSMIADGSILRKLQKLQIVLRAVSIPDQGGFKITNTQIPEENIEQVIRFMKTASAYLPRLTEIKLTTLDSERKKIRVCRRKKSRNNINVKKDSDGIFERHSFYDFLDAYR